MPTDEWFKENPKVSAYIPHDLYEKLSDWMKGRNIKKVSQALTAILEEYLGVVQNEPITQPVRDDRLEALEQKFEKKFESLSQIVEQKFESLSQIIQEIKGPAQASSLEVVQTELFPVEPTEEITLINANQPIEVVEEIQDKRVDQTELIEHEIWTTSQVKEFLGTGRSSLEDWKKKNAFPKTIKEHTILKWAGKQTKQPFGNLWEVKKLHSADPKTITAYPESDTSDF